MYRILAYAGAVFIGSVASLGGGYAGHKKAPEAEVMRAAESVVEVYAESGWGKTQEGRFYAGFYQRSSGFIVKRKWVVTSAHGLSYAVKFNREPRVMCGGRAYGARIVQYDVKHDLALLCLRNETPVKGLRWASVPRIQGKVFLVGYPYGGVREVVSGSADQNVRLSPGDRTLFGDVSIIRAGVSPGYSGGAVLNSRGEVIGMILATCAQEALTLATTRKPPGLL